MVRVAINGFGRIGRTALRVYLERYCNQLSLGSSCGFSIDHINSKDVSPEYVAYALRYDSIYGVLPDHYNLKVCTNGILRVGEKEISVSSEDDIAKLDWKNLGVDVVLECTGVFNKVSDLKKHLDFGGAKRVIVSAPCAGVDATVIIGVNHHGLNGRERLLSVSSCTTNCFMPILKVLQGVCGIEEGFMTTVHSYTNDQCLVDARHRDYVRGRAAALSIIPTSTGAASSIGEVMPELDGKIKASSLRVPTPNVSLIDFTFTSKLESDNVKITQAMSDYSVHNKNIMKVNYDPVVSIDFVGSSYSAVFDACQSISISNSMHRVIAWYDNEWGFVNRLIDLCQLISEKL